ncbi:MAG TPA: methyltransferase domain-containing protein [Streptosporangiaceae bacterium]|nr:methyltransferase domain-containing protein [Streptosporangiaceae bacterium]
MNGQTRTPGNSSYSLRLSEQELARYRLMAASAADHEAAEWSAAGIRPGARVADVGCGPGAVLRLLAERVGPTGEAVGVDADPSAVAAAERQLADLPQARVLAGQADATGLEPGGFDMVMCRHVLAHNGGHEAAIVGHLASLAAPGGCVYLVDVDATALRLTHVPPELTDLQERYAEFHRARGNDLSVGLRLGDLLTGAALTVERYACRAPVVRLQPGMRPPSWAARHEMMAQGFATEADIERWAGGFSRLDSAERRPWLFPANFVAIGRRG